MPDRPLNPALRLRTSHEWPPHPDATPFWVAWSDRYGEDFAAGYDATEEYATDDLVCQLIEKGVSPAEIWETSDA